MRENGRGWPLTERANGGGDADGIRRGRRSDGGVDGKAMGGLPSGCLK
jgi:hypothetical protein